MTVSYDAVKNNRLLAEFIDEDAEETSRSGE